MDNRILIKTVFGRTLYHSIDEHVQIYVDKADLWQIRIEPIKIEFARLIQEQVNDVHAFYFEPNRKWWLSHSKKPDVYYDSSTNTLNIGFDTIFEYSPDQM